MNSALRERRIATLLEGVHVPRPEPVHPLLAPAVYDFEASNLSSSDEARALLIQQRTLAPDYKPPEKQLRHRFSTSRIREKRINPEEWQFTKHEVAKTLNGILSSTPLAHAGVAQALLSHRSVQTLDELWYHFQDAKLEKMGANHLLRRTSSLLRKPTSSGTSRMPWLDRVTSLNELAYVRLFCQTGVSQVSLNRALGIALAERFVDAIELLLSYGAVASSHKGILLERLKADDVVLARLLLSAPQAMTVEDWRSCIIPQLERLPRVLPLCLATRPDVVCPSLLFKALELQDLIAATITLTYGATNQISLSFESAAHPTIGQAASSIVTGIQDVDKRYKFFQLLDQFKLLADNPILRRELLKDVKTRHYPLIRILTKAGVKPDVEPDNSLHCAVTSMDLEALAMLKDSISLPVSPALALVPDSASQADVIRLLDLFSPLNLNGEPLDELLNRAARHQQVQLVEKLVNMGASVEYQQADGICAALQRPNFDILALLLARPCSPETLSFAIDPAMRLTSRPDRHKAMNALVEKGILRDKLRQPLRTLLVEKWPMDSKLIGLLLKRGAPIDETPEHPGNVLHVAARRGDLTILRMLCEAGPSIESLSGAVPLAYRTIETSGNQMAMDAINMLLHRGATGEPVNQTLVRAAQDRRLSIVRVMIENGADANYKSGACFTIAIMSHDTDLLNILCVKCQPNRTSTEAVLPTAVDATYYNSLSLNTLLMFSTAAAAALDATWSPERLRGHPKRTDIVLCFLRHGLDVNVDGGSLLCLAIEEMDLELLRKILNSASSLKKVTLKKAFQTATTCTTRHVELEAMRLLLEKAGSEEIGQTNALLHQTRLSLTGDSTGLQLVLLHKAMVNVNEGQALQLAASEGALPIMRLLTTYEHSYLSLSAACMVVARSSLAPKTKRAMFEYLLTACNSVLAQNMSQLLADCIAKLPDHTQLPTLLLDRQATLSFDVIRKSTETASLPLFKLLISKVTTSDQVATLLEHARALHKIPDPERRYMISKCLLESGIPINPDDMSENLLHALETDDPAELRFTKLFLQHRVNVGYGQGKAFHLACRDKSMETFMVLSQSVDRDTTAEMAFEVARKAAFPSAQIRVDIYRCLLQWNVSEVSLYAALLDQLKSAEPSTTVIELLLEKGANPNRNHGECFKLTAKKPMTQFFRIISKYGKLEVVLQALLSELPTEMIVVGWFRLCLNQQRQTAIPENLVFQCLQRYPQGAELLTLLLESGASASAMRSCVLCPGWKAEQCTVLIWALFSEPRIGNKAILALIGKGGAATQPAYCTPLTKVSAVLGCLIDRGRAPILRALLELNDPRIQTYQVPRNALTRLCIVRARSESGASIEDLPPSFDIRQASLWLGNLETFRLTFRGQRPPRDESYLHTAALLALPRIVEWLLKYSDANYEAEDFDHFIPLVVVCRAEPIPWPIIANSEADFRTRQKETMRLLATKTNLKWRRKGKTVLHFAFEHGVETTKAMMEALGTGTDAQRYEKYVFTDRAGVQYQPAEYIKVWMDGLDDAEKVALIKCLPSGGFFA